MATNLRLRPDAEEAVRVEAERSGRSQQEVIRDAIDHQLGLGAKPGPTGELAALVAAGTVRAPATPYRKASKRIKLPSGVSSADLLEREDRI